MPKKPIELVLDSVNDALLALRETPSRPKDAFHSLKYASSWLKTPANSFEHCAKVVIADCEDHLKLNNPNSAFTTLSNLQPELMVYVTKTCPRV